MSNPHPTEQPARTKAWTAPETLRALMRTMARPGVELTWPSCVDGLDRIDRELDSETYPHIELMAWRIGWTGLLAWAEALTGAVRVKVLLHKGTAHIHVIGRLHAGPWVKVTDIINEPPAHLAEGEMAPPAFRELVSTMARESVPA